MAITRTDAQGRVIDSEGRLTGDIRTDSGKIKKIESGVSLAKQRGETPTPDPSITISKPKTTRQDVPTYISGGIPDTRQSVLPIEQPKTTRQDVPTYISGDLTKDTIDTRQSVLPIEQPKTTRQDIPTYISGEIPDTRQSVMRDVSIARDVYLPTSPMLAALPKDPDVGPRKKRDPLDLQLSEEEVRQRVFSDYRKLQAERDRLTAEYEKQMAGGEQHIEYLKSEGDKETQKIEKFNQKYSDIQKTTEQLSLKSQELNSEWDVYKNLEEEYKRNPTESQYHVLSATYESMVAKTNTHQKNIDVFEKDMKNRGYTKDYENVIASQKAIDKTNLEMEQSGKKYETATEKYIANMEILAKADKLDWGASQYKKKFEEVWGDEDISKTEKFKYLLGSGMVGIAKIGRDVGEFAIFAPAREFKEDVKAKDWSEIIKTSLTPGGYTVKGIYDPSDDYGINWRGVSGVVDVAFMGSGKVIKPIAQFLKTVVVKTLPKPIAKILGSKAVRYTATGALYTAVPAAIICPEVYQVATGKETLPGAISDITETSARIGAIGAVAWKVSKPKTTGPKAKDIPPVSKVKGVKDKTIKYTSGRITRIVDHGKKGMYVESEYSPLGGWQVTKFRPTPKPKPKKTVTEGPTLRETDFDPKQPFKWIKETPVVKKDALLSHARLQQKMMSGETLTRQEMEALQRIIINEKVTGVRTGIEDIYKQYTIRPKGPYVVAKEYPTLIPDKYRVKSRIDSRYDRELYKTIDKTRPYKDWGVASKADDVGITPLQKLEERAKYNPLSLTKTETDMIEELVKKETSSAKSVEDFKWTTILRDVRMAFMNKFLLKVTKPKDIKPKDIKPKDIKPKDIEPKDIEPTTKGLVLVDKAQTQKEIFKDIKKQYLKTFDDLYKSDKIKFISDKAKVTPKVKPKVKPLETYTVTKVEPKVKPKVKPKPKTTFAIGSGVSQKLKSVTIKKIQTKPTSLADLILPQKQISKVKKGVKVVEPRPTIKPPSVKQYPAISTITYSTTTQVLPTDQRVYTDTAVDQYQEVKPYTTTALKALPFALGALGLLYGRGRGGGITLSSKQTTREKVIVNKMFLGKKFTYFDRMNKMRNKI